MCHVPLSFKLRILKFVPSFWCADSEVFIVMFRNKVCLLNRYVCPPAGSGFCPVSIQKLQLGPGFGSAPTFV